MKIVEVDIDSVSQDPANLRRHGIRNLDAIKASLRKFGQQKPIVVSGEDIILAGNGTWEAAKSLGWDKIKIVRTTLKGSDATGFSIADNRTAALAEWDETALAETLRALQSEDFDIEAAGFTAEELDALIEGLGDELVGKEGEGGGGAEGKADASRLADRFGVPPFSILNAREGWWQDRKAQWIALGIKSELGRGEAVTWGVSPEGTPTAKSRATAAPGGSRMPAVDKTTGKIVRSDSRARPIRPKTKAEA